MSTEHEQEPRASRLGPICPNCRQALRGNIAYEQLAASHVSGTSPARLTLVTYCANCGWTLEARASRRPFSPANDGQDAVVADPEDPSSLEGTFQLRCKELVEQITALNFYPTGWIRLINRRGALGAAQHLLETQRILPVSHWLVGQHHEELSLEHELREARWQALFTDEQRAEALRRLEQLRTHEHPHAP